MNTEYNQWYWKVYRWWKWKAKYFHRDVIKGIKNLWKWFPIVWKDRDWDDSYIFDVLKFKLKNTADYFEKTNSFVGWEDEVKYIRICERLIDKIQDEYYRMEYYDDKYLIEKIKIINGKVEVDVLKNNIEEYIIQHPRTKEKVLKLDKYKSYMKSTDGIAMAIGMERHVKARKLLFKIMEEKIERWWS
jgi:hypothetical protein